MAIESKRVYELAKEYGKGNKEFIEYIEQKLGIVVKSHSSGLTPFQVEKIRALFEKKTVQEPAKKPKAFIVKKAKPKHQEVQTDEAQDKKKEPQAEIRPEIRSEIRPEIRSEIRPELRRIIRPEIKPAAMTEIKPEIAAKMEQPPKQETSSETKEVQIKEEKLEKKTEKTEKEAEKLENTPEEKAADETEQKETQAESEAAAGYRSLLEYNNKNSRRRREELFAQKQRLERERAQQQKKEAGKPDSADKNKPAKDKSRLPLKKTEADKDKRQEKTQDRAERPMQRRPLQHHVIPQEIYSGKPGQDGVFKRGSSKDKKKQYKNKEEEQELISLEKTQTQKHKKKAKDAGEEGVIKQAVINTPITSGELSKKIGRPVSEIVKFLMMQGILTTVNEVLSVETQKKICANFEIEVLEEDLNAYIEEELEKEEKQNKIKNTDEALLETRAPVASIMGHVDHGKTTLLDSIRASKHKITASEAGGITQSIGAYSVFLHDNKDKKIVFIDTPGHEAFTEMRARGAKATDIAILVVAADDGIMPQTIEAINHAKAAEIPIICAINKIDKPDANPDKVMQQLTEYGLVPEEWGGDTICVKVSALQGKGIDELLEYILLVAEVQNLRADKTAPASGVIIEAKLDKGKGPVATLLVQNGTLRTGGCFNAGKVCGRIRAMISDSGERVKEAGPSTPVEVLGLEEVPQAGDMFEIAANEKEMREIAEQRREKERASKLDSLKQARIRNEHLTGDENIKHLNLIIKANTHGSAEAVSQGVSRLESKEIITKIIHAGVGDISEADVMLAGASDAIILGFSVKEDANAQAAAEKYGITIKKFNIIYQVLEDLEKTMLSLLEPEIKEVFLGAAEVRKVFTIGKTSKIAGCYVTEGKIVRNKTAVILRGGNEIYKGQIDQLKRFKDDVKEAAQGFECGISFEKFNDIQEGDIIKVTTTEESARQALV